MPYAGLIRKPAGRPSSGTPQTSPIPGREAAMARNAAGGFAFKLDVWQRLRRFLILGSDSGTFYVQAQPLTADSMALIEQALTMDAARVVDEILAVSLGGLAPRNDAAVFALAVAASRAEHPDQRTLALTALPKVCRIGTHLFQFVSAVDALRGWGPSLRQAVARWYTDKDIKDLAFGMVKYQAREGWSHRDVLRLCHAKPKTATMSALFAWAVKGTLPKPQMTTLAPVRNLARAMELREDPKALAALVSEAGLTREMLPSEALRSPLVWQAMIPKIPPHAMLRNLANMTRLGALGAPEQGIRYMLNPKAKADAKTTAAGKMALKQVLAKLGDYPALRKARVHPMALLLANAAYSTGRSSHRDEQTWAPIREVQQALQQGFVNMLADAPASRAKILLAIDVSGSMRGACLSNTNLTAAEAAAAWGLVLVKSEPNVTMASFNESCRHRPDLEGASSLQDFQAKVNASISGGTDCAAPIRWAASMSKRFDAMILLTDNETWHGESHPAQALDHYRRSVNPGCRLVVVSMTATATTVGDPEDINTLQVVGMDAGVPGMVTRFIAGQQPGEPLTTED